MVSGALPAMFSDFHMIAAVMNFMERPGTALRILVQGGLEAGGGLVRHPMVRAVEALRERGEMMGSPTVQLLSDAWWTSMRKRGMPWHWATMDVAAYRLKLDVDKPGAIANFGDPAFAQGLADAFDAIAADRSGNSVLSRVQAQPRRRRRRRHD